MTPKTVEPALTPEEWTARAFQEEECRVYITPPVASLQAGERVNADQEGGGHEGVSFEHRRHALAALCLYGEPFGFTQGDVAVLRDFARRWMAGPLSECDHLESLADRIAALLPPPPSV